MTYAEKLKDPRWLDFRAGYIALQERCHALKNTSEPLRCSCGAEGPTHVHHKEYIYGRDPWEYDLHQLSLICGECHALIHECEKEYRAFILRSKPSVSRELLSFLKCVQEQDHPHQAIFNAWWFLEDDNDKRRTEGKMP